MPILNAGLNSTGSLPFPAEDRAALLVIARPDVEQEAGGVNLEPGIRFLGWRITSHYRP